MTNNRILLLLFVVGLYSCTSSGLTIAVLPDTQTYAQKFPHIVDHQLKWLDSNSRKFDYVLQLGDLTQNNVDSEWVVIRNAFNHIENSIPYSIVAGNHDLGNNGRADVRNSDLFNKYFPSSGFSGTYGLFEDGKSDNFWKEFKKGNNTWIIMGLEFGPRNEVLDWADMVAKEHSDKTIILFTHGYMYSDSTRLGEGDSWRPQAYGIGKDTGTKAVNDGEQIWEKLVKPNANIRVVLSGHVLHSGVGTRVDDNDAGLPVYQLLQNYQEGVRGSENGGNGYMRIMKINTKKQTINISTYSPYLRKIHDGSGQNFEFRNIKFGG